MIFSRDNLWDFEQKKLQVSLKTVKKATCTLLADLYGTVKGIYGQHTLGFTLKDCYFQR